VEVLDIEPSKKVNQNTFSNESITIVVIYALHKTRKQVRLI
jgi:hypothetical protein